MYADKGRLMVLKGFMDFAAFCAAIELVPMGVPAAFHFRIGTNGAKDAVNTHPWQIDANSALVHNGIISWLAGNKDVSDSGELARVLHGIDWTDPMKAKLIEEGLGWNKVVIMNGEGQHVILNASKGTWEDGCWYSNHGFRPIKTYVYEPQEYPKREYEVAPYKEQPKQTSILDAITVTFIAVKKKDRLVCMRLKGRQIVKMVYQDFVKHYDVYDYATPKLAGQADQLALAIMDLLVLEAG